MKFHCVSDAGVKKKELYLIFVDLEEASDREPRCVIKCVMRKLGIKDWLIQVVMLMYVSATTQVRVSSEMTDIFSVNLGVQKRSILIFLMFTMVVDALSCEFSIELL